MSSYLDTKIEFLKGVGPAKAKLLNEELGVYTFNDLVHYFPFRYENRTEFVPIGQIDAEQGPVQIRGIIVGFGLVGPGKKQRLVATIMDQTGQVELIWFTGASWMADKLKKNTPYLVYGRPTTFNGKISISHPEMDILIPDNEDKNIKFVPIYPSTDKLRKRYLDNKAIVKLQAEIVSSVHFNPEETLDTEIIASLQLISKKQALNFIHFPKDLETLKKAELRLKFEELFFIQLNMLQDKFQRNDKTKGIIFNKSDLVNTFYKEHLPFDLTDAQKRVIKEIYADMQSGYQMNRLLQGDVGCGKTITAFICVLIAISSGYQSTIMAPTEILAHQHLAGLEEYCQLLGISIAMISGSTKKSKRKEYLEKLASGQLDILIGTHALIEEDVRFSRLGLAVIDEQHRFGVAQRAKLWQKNKEAYPHVLVMTATPIPRTLAMTLYGDLEISTINELPKGRKPVKTTHMTDSARAKLFGFMRQQMDLGRQIYIVYPLIEESSKLDYKDLMDGFESISRAFPLVPLSILHGKMKPADKDFEMNRFVKGETKIMVATTVIEVGVNVPNASIMVVENSERFGLSQLHQLRGRVGRGADQSYCILMAGQKLSKEARERIKCMVSTTDGFEIAEKDLELRGPGDLMGTQQSGALNLKISNLATDGHILKLARETAKQIIADDPNLASSNHAIIARELKNKKNAPISWSIIS